MLGRIALILARFAAAAIRPLERVALASLRGFTTSRGPVLFHAAAALLIGALAALIVYAPGPGHPAYAKIGLGLIAFALFCGYLRAYFAVKSETEAALAGLLREDEGEMVAVTQDVTDRLSPEPRFPGLLNGFGLAVFMLGLAAAHTAVAAGLLEGGFGPMAADLSGAPATPTALDWGVHAFWASFGSVDLFGLLPRAGEPLFGLRYDWGWAFGWIALFRLAILGVLFSLASACFDARRKVSIALERPGLWWEKRQHLRRLGRAGFHALTASLADPDPWRREDAARMLGAVGYFPEESAQALIRSLTDVEPTVRERAAESLGALGAAAAVAVPALIARLEDEADAVRREAASALGSAAAERPRLAAAAMDALSAVCPEDPEVAAATDWRLLVATARSLAELAASVGFAEEAAVQAVDRLRGHPEGYVRQTAVEAYGQLKSAARAEDAHQSRG